MAEARREYWVEWVDTKTLQTLAERAIKAANRKRLRHGEPPLDVADEVERNPLDWCPSECALLGRKFPSLGLAKAWATKNRALDLWNEPRVYVNEFTPSDPWPMEDERTVAEWRFDGHDELQDVSAELLTA